MQAYNASHAINKGLNADVKEKMSGLRVKDCIEKLDLKAKLNLKEKIASTKDVVGEKSMPSCGKIGQSKTASSEIPETKGSSETESRDGDGVR